MHATAACVAAPDNGFGDQYSWCTLDSARDEARLTNKPIMLIIHKTWCGACKALKPAFQASPEISKLAKDFVLVNLQDGEEPKGDEFSPDGQYIPRLFFLSADGSVLDVYNKQGNAKYKYFYPQPDSIVRSMKEVLAL
eukprot:NODE_6595_length_519_cov_20.852041_g6430_i0.p2 GENE.NODE_6595_length_519_cov_20.852041_g6430_i0~~NODE_6595_length_519_cov_20.852041_g6430_i0.p2  ORF type:complete len:150 (-),score=40.03 NODE_6595_length_519_cov_20.852041_g6430_i0:69-482(-)